MSKGVVYFSSKGIYGFIRGDITDVDNKMNVTIENATVDIYIGRSEVRFNAVKVKIRGSYVVLITYDRV